MRVARHAFAIQLIGDVRPSAGVVELELAERTDLIAAEFMDL